MNIGHKQLIWEELSKRGYMTHQEVIDFARKERYYKESEIERRLRPSESPCIQADTRKADTGGSYIHGYVWICPTPYKVETKADKQRARIAAEERRILANPALLQ